RSAVLSYAVLSYAVLRSAVLSYAVLRSAVLSYAKLPGGEKISDSPRPFLQVGGLGSDGRMLLAFSTDKGIRLTTGCFFGSVDEFKAKLKTTHGDNVHAVEYEAALTLIETHFKLWPAKKS
ncbi:MAG: pentapeptide repeat-containing protein, partial [Verrucomicrobia bacterium]|nr:pentapeptide repeat-containing protein [Verrucomicrobiota bacterium]